MVQKCNSLSEDTTFGVQDVQDVQDVQGVQDGVKMYKGIKDDLW